MRKVRFHEDQPGSCLRKSLKTGEAGLKVAKERHEARWGGRRVGWTQFFGKEQHEDRRA